MPTVQSYKSKILSLDKPVNAVFLVTIPAAYTGGTLKLGYAGQMTADIDRFATPEDAEDAFEALGLVGAGNCRFSWSPDGTWEIELIGTFAGKPTARITADGSDLTPDAGEPVAVKMLKAGRASYFSELVDGTPRIDTMWTDRASYSTDQNAPTELHYLYVRLDALVELRNLAWTQIDQQEGDSRREYEAQYKHLSAMENETRAQIATDEAEAAKAADAARNQTHWGVPTVRSDIFDRFRGRC